MFSIVVAPCPLEAIGYKAGMAHLPQLHQTLFVSVPATLTFFCPLTLSFVCEHHIAQAVLDMESALENIRTRVSLPFRASSRISHNPHSCSICLHGMLMAFTKKMPQTPISKCRVPPLCSWSTLCYSVFRCFVSGLTCPANHVDPQSMFVLVLTGRPVSKRHLINSHWINTDVGD